MFSLSAQAKYVIFTGINWYNRESLRFAQSGMYSLLRMRQLGLKAKVLEAGSGEGGTWFW